MIPDDLTRMWGFSLNPFGTSSAEIEEQTLKFNAKSFFINPPYFQRIVGDPRHPTSTIIIGDRGSGKSIICSRVRQELLKIKSAKILVVDYMPFSDLSFKDTYLENISLEYHINKIIKLCLNSFIKELEESPYLLDNLDSYDKISLIWFIDKYHCKYPYKHPFNHENLFVASIRKIKNKANLELNRSALDKRFEALGGLDLLGNLKDLIKGAGFISIYILIDKLDENRLSHAKIGRFILPLLTSLEYLELDDIATKLFIPTEIGHQLRYSIRSDRIDVFNLHWDNRTLLEMLSKRLMAYSEGKINTLKSFVESDIADFFENTILYYSANNPRNLLRLINTIIYEFCDSEVSTTYITKWAIINGVREFWAQRNIEYDSQIYLTRLMHNSREFEGKEIFFDEIINKSLLVSSELPNLDWNNNDNVPTWKDDPLEKPNDDLLGRDAFARYLCALIRGSIYCRACNGKGCALCKLPSQTTNANHILLYGPWGAGKSTLLNFAKAELKKDRNWLVVEFNAWRNQHIRAPWWSLMNCVFQEIKKELSMQNKIQEYWWRFNSGHIQYPVAVLLLLGILFSVGPLIIYKVIDISNLRDFSIFANIDSWKDTSVILDIIWKSSLIISAIYTFVIAINRSLLFGSAQAAQNYTEFTNDPMGEIKRRFEKLIDHVKPKHVAVFIDDLDRCQSSYVVELLDGIQTLFYQAPVVFVVAADRLWINASYEQVYEKLNYHAKESGKPLGTLFLEKIFRFSTPMPGVTEELKQRYWTYLLHLNPEEMKADLTNAQKKARDEVANAESEEEVRRLVESKKERTFAEQRAIREEAAVRLAAPEIIDRLEHALQPYSKFLEPNPRSMKHLVNAYNANRVLALLSEVEIDRHQLVLWTILSLRWPMLADYLEEFPDRLEYIGQKEIVSVPDYIRTLFSNAEVENLIMTNPSLKRDTIKRCTKLHAL
ncbi:MAG: P-loop NTPase fold protein [Methanothrix sp.]|nr:P-loop NTPase fold protein [Methanothrix sp.]MDD4446424.1 P-loop NTPase fold protein [Methanothrix sp.]